MDFFQSVASKYLANGFPEETQLSIQSLSNELSLGETKCISREISPCQRYYEVVNQMVGDSGTINFTSYENLEGKYIGDEATLRTIVHTYGINPEAIDGYNVCQIGKSDQDDKWYGWSHRAIGGFESRDEAVQFAISVSSVSLADIMNPFQSESAPLRKQKPDLFSWYRFNGARGVILKNETTKLKQKIEKGLRFGVRYIPRNKELVVMTEAAPNEIYVVTEKQASNLFSKSKPTRGKIFGVAVTGEKNDFLLPRDRKQLDKHKEADVPAKPKRKPKANEARHAAPPKKEKIQEPKHVSEEDQVQVRDIARVIGSTEPTSRLRPFTNYAWLRYNGKRVRKIATVDKGDAIDGELEPKDIIGISYEPKHNEIILVLVKDEPKIQFELTITQARSILKECAPFTGKIRNKTCKFDRKTVLAQVDALLSKDFSKRYKSLLDAEVNARAQLDIDVAAPETEIGYTQKESKAIEQALDRGELIWFAVAETNVNTNKVRCMFANSARDAKARLMKFVSDKSEQHITVGQVSAANNIYRSWIKDGSKAAGTQMGINRKNALIRDAVEGSVRKSKNDKYSPDVRLEIPEFNDSYAEKVKRSELAPVFSGNDVEILSEISRAMTVKGAYTSSYKPRAKLHTLKSGRIALVLAAQHNSDKYRQEGEQAVRRMQQVYNSRQIVGRFTERNGTLFLFIIIARLADQNDEAIEQLAKMRTFMTHGTTVNQDVRDKSANELVLVREAITTTRTILKSQEEELEALRQRIDKFTEDFQDVMEKDQFDEEIRDLNRQIRKVENSIKKSTKAIKDGEIRAFVLDKAVESKETQVGRVYTTEDGTQVKILRADYKKGQFIVENTGGERTQNIMSQRDIQSQINRLARTLEKGVSSEEREDILDKIDILTERQSELGSVLYSRSYAVKHLYSLTGELLV